MHIKKIALFEFRRPFKLTFLSPHTSRTSAESVVVQLIFENGIAGYGESAPRDYVTGETCSTVADLVEKVFAPALLSHPITSAKDVHELLNSLEQECLERAFKHYNSALGAIDIALLDALGNAQKLPAADYLGPMRQKKAPLSISLPLVPLEKIEGLFAKYRNLDFKHIKIILSQNAEDNRKRVELVRNLLGGDVDLRVEANGKWTYEQAVSNLEKLMEYGISSVEEPLSIGDIKGFQKLKRLFDLNIIVDESMCSLSDATALIEAGACDVLNIKISKCGGLLRSKAISEFAEDRGLPCCIGCHVGESEILGQAARHLAPTMRNLRHIEGYTMLLFEDTQGMVTTETGWTRLENAKNCQGLGLTQVGTELRDKWFIPLAEFS